MSSKMRNVSIMAAVLVFSVLVWSAVAAQDATVEPTAEAAATAEAPAAATAEAPTTGADMPSVGRPFLGVSLQAEAGGVTIVEVQAGSAAETAGLMAGDVITAVNGTSVTTVAEVADAIGALKAGDEVTIAYTRDGAAMTATATLGSQMQAPMQNRNGQNGQNVPNNGQRPPMQNRNGQDRLGEMFGFEYNSDNQTWTISRLADNSPLYTAGLRQGDVITAVDGKAYDPAGLMQYLVTLSQDAKVKLSIERDGAAQDIEIAASDLMSIGFGGLGFMHDDFGGNGAPFDFSQMMPMMQFAYGNGRLGVAFEPIDAQLAQEHNLTVTAGALITEVQTGTPAEKAGLKVNDVVTAVDGEAVDEEHTLRDRLIAYEPGDTVTLTVLRDGASQDIQATLDEPQMTGMGDMGNLFNDLPFHFRGGNGNGNGNGGFPFDMQPNQNGTEATPEATPNA